MKPDSLPIKACLGLSIAHQGTQGSSSLLPQSPSLGPSEFHARFLDFAALFILCLQMLRLPKTSEHGSLLIQSHGFRISQGGPGVLRPALATFVASFLDYMRPYLNNDNNKNKQTKTRKEKTITGHLFSDSRPTYELYKSSLGRWRKGICMAIRKQLENQTCPPALWSQG